MIITWLEFLELSLSLFTTENSVSVFHPTHTPYPNTSGDIVVEFNPNVHIYLSMLVGQYVDRSGDCPQDGELDFIFHTLKVRAKEDLKNPLWVVEVTEVEKMTPDERMTFVCDELSRAIGYFRDFFDPDLPPWDVTEDEVDTTIPVFANRPDACWDCEHNSLNTCSIEYVPIPNPNGSGHCLHRDINPRIEYGNSPRMNRAIKACLKEREGE